MPVLGHFRGLGAFRNSCCILRQFCRPDPSKRAANFGLRSILLVLIARTRVCLSVRPRNSDPTTSLENHQSARTLRHRGALQLHEVPATIFPPKRVATKRMCSRSNPTGLGYPWPVDHPQGQSDWSGDSCSQRITPLEDETQSTILIFPS